MSDPEFQSVPARAEDGFTLIELLVSLGLMGMAATLLLQGLVTAGIVAKRERSSEAALEEVVAVQRILRGSIERLRPVMRTDSGLPIIDLRGTAGVLTFVAPPIANAAPDALQRYRLTRTAKGDLVLFSANSLAPDIDTSGADLIGWTPHTLLHGIRDIAIGYYGSARPGQRRGWQNGWWDRSTPPELIRVRLQFADGDRRMWPDLIIRPPVTKYGQCVIEFATNKCVEER
ncbi:MAG: type II secretion system protein [Sphingobium sp.]|nr:type II secretion system protein [Sphingobium sp.]